MTPTEQMAYDTTVLKYKLSEHVRKMYSYDCKIILAEMEDAISRRDDPDLNPNEFDNYKIAVGETLMTELATAKKIFK